MIDFDALRADPAAYSLLAVELPEPLRFGQSPAQDLDLLRLLRAVTSHAVRLRWTLSGRPSFPLHTYSHLLPPCLGVELDDVTHTVARARDYRYGSFYYRRGPGDRDDQRRPTRPAGLADGHRGRCRPVRASRRVGGRPPGGRRRGAGR
ncbi:DUF5825 family protein [Micromonospora craniellae]|uniref:DUF5825 family protein n=1 Tax=Micromonospora craniellae TaxID=2294034 RepID=UPI0011C18DA3|nr:DUF5825 family protein [Micromonospora craniellae]